MKKDRKKAEANFLKKLAKIDKFTDADNVGRYKAIFADMSDIKFDEYVQKLVADTACMYIYIPHFEKHPTTDDVVKLAREFDVELFRYISWTNPQSGQVFTPPYKCFCGIIPLRRMPQYGEHKIGVGDGANKVDAMTGQVVHGSRAAGMSNPEAQAMNAKGLNVTLGEMIGDRGGNIEVQRVGITRQAEETGEVLLSEISRSGTHRTPEMGETLFDSLMIKNNITGRNDPVEPIQTK